MKTHIVDVFAETPFSGNQLAVVTEASSLDTATMQKIAQELNFSETSFVTEHDDHHASVRIFTPAQELPFAGHPTLGTAWVLGRDQEEYTLGLAVGDITVRFDKRSNISWMQAPKPSYSEGIDRIFAAKLLGLRQDDFLKQYPIKLAKVGPEFHIIALRNLDALRRCNISTDAYTELASNSESVAGLFIFCPEAHSSNAQYAARAFFDVNGPREDPATGSANTCFADYLYHYARKPGEEEVSTIVDQGVEMGRPSKIYLSVGDVIEVGGKVQTVMTGELNI